jgi:hypothetical protein
VFTSRANMIVTPGKFWAETFRRIVCISLWRAGSSSTPWLGAWETCKPGWQRRCRSGTNVICPSPKIICETRPRSVSDRVAGHDA